ncbi:hypothetical protein MRX96_019745 [Rhipicephalus microplus]
MLDTMKVMVVPVSRVAVLCRRPEALQLGNMARQFPFAVTLWTCVNDRDCYRHFVRYVTQEVDFPRPGLIAVPRHASLPPALFLQVAEFQKYNSNVNWIFSVEKHSDVLDKLISHSCNVITVSKREINAPHDAYKICEQRRMLHSPYTVLSENLPPPGTYLRHEVINYALQDGPSKSCSNFQGSAVKAAVEAYVTLNNTLKFQCNTRKNSRSIILDRRADFLFGTRSINCALQTPCFYYGYSMYSPSYFCFLVRRGEIMYPSFARNWFSFLKLSVTLTPCVAMFMFLLRLQNLFFPNEASSVSVASDFLLSTFLGRCPPPGMRSTLLSSKLSIFVWSVGVFFLANFVQMEISASRSVPSHSSEIRHMQQLAEKFDTGAMLPCVSLVTSRVLRRSVCNVSYLESVRAAPEGCGMPCTSYGSHNGCHQKLQFGVYAGITIFRASMLALAQENELVLGKDSFLMALRMSPTHGRYPLRHQHRRLLMALEESGLLQAIEERVFASRQDRMLISFNVAVYDYMFVYVAGISASLVAFLLECTVTIVKGIQITDLVNMHGPSHYAKEGKEIA